MLRPLTVCAALLCLVPVCVADDPPAPTETVVKLTVSPAAAPRPALKYQLLPELREMNPGNPIPGYMKCFAEQTNFYHNKQAVEDREKWQTVPLKELPARDLLNYGGSSLKQADYAARLDAPNWDLLLPMRKQGYQLMLPDIQQLRTLAGALKVRFRAEVAERRFDDAVVTAKTMMALARHLGEHPALISEVVGMAIANLALGPVEEMIGQPGSPNLYWALTDLPSPLVDIRKGIQGDRLMMERQLDVLDTKAPMSEEQFKKAMTRLAELVEVATLGRTREVPKPLQTWIEDRVKDEAHVNAARQRLIDNGLAEDAVKKFPALQVVLIDDKFTFEARHDEVTKWLSLPYWQAEAGLRDRPMAANLLEMMMDEFLNRNIASPAQARKIQARLEQRLALLRHVEALRLYAAANDGKLPAKLEDVKVPLPVDPMTGKPFIYKVDGLTAILQGTPPRGEEKNATYNLRYEVTIRK